MSVPTDGTPVSEPSANGGVTPEMKNEFQKVVMGILKDAMPRMIKQSIGEALPSLLEQVTASQVKDRPADKEPEAKGEQARYKGLENTINELKLQIQKRDEALEQKESQRVDALMRAQVREGLASVLGADNQNLGLVMDSYYEARKRFVPGQDGSPLVKFKSEYGGEDELVPLADGIKRLADKELKHLIPAKTGNLPVVPGQRRGNPVAGQQSGAPNPLDRIMNDVISRVSLPTADPTQK